MTRFEAPPYEGLQRFDDYADVDEILRSAQFRQGSHGESLVFFGDSLLLTDGEDHLTRRRLASTLFSRAALQVYETEALLPVISRLMLDLEDSRGADGIIRADFVPLARAMLTRITALVVGVDDVDTPENTEIFQSYVAKLGVAASVEWSLRDHDEVVAEGVEAKTAIIEEFLRPSMAKRQELATRLERGELQREDLPTDLLTMLAVHADQFSGLDDDYVWREAILALVAASQTTTHALPHVLMHLEKWFETHPEDRERVQESEFVRRAVTESLRLHQPAPALTRIATSDVQLRSGRTIADGEQVALFFTSANRDVAKFGGEAEEFDLSRDLPTGTQPWGLNFGSGIHMCLGRPLVTGQPNKADESQSTEGTMVKIVKAVYRAGFTFDPDNPPQRQTHSVHDTFESMPILLRDPAAAAESVRGTGTEVA
ncbi:cytochrome P450 [Nocardioides hwasunensis]|uniref:Cytochrome P450 n=1 Tax=Nocardioides hwasunensis TaxID=397258 RepID=A0ABR8MKN0_9ACTN|nr:cytochrome P450 [Nocardioides hwasunensis]MBD3915074.1 cytochrome P450 [Nocardioides hwasunensis]